MTLIALDIETSGLIQKSSAGPIYPDVYQVSLAVQRSSVFDFEELEVYELLFPGNLDLKSIINKAGLWSLKTHLNNGLFLKLIEAMPLLIQNNGTSNYVKKYQISENHQISILKNIDISLSLGVSKVLDDIYKKTEDKIMLIGKNLNAFDLPILTALGVKFPFPTYRNMDIGSIVHIDYSRITSFEGLPSMDNLINFFYEYGFDKDLNIPEEIKHMGHDATVDCIHTLALYDVFKNRERLYERVSQ